jgi:PD-(D/E)XK nuclease superfamily protein
LVKVKRLSPRKLGEVAELVFMARAAALGFNVLRPNAPCRYDLALDTGRRLLRIQVKSTATQRKGQYAISAASGPRRRRYTTKEIDFLVAWVAPLNTWYIIPAKVIASYAGVCFSPQVATRRWTERYREAWQLLGRSITRLPDTSDGQIVVAGRPQGKDGQWL